MLNSESLDFFRESLEYKLIVVNLLNPTMAGIHLAGTTGEMLVCLYMPAQPPPGRYDGVLAERVVAAGDLQGPLARATSLQGLVDEMNAGNTVVHVCTAQHEPEIAGPIR